MVDFRKAFGLVDHDFLLHKLSLYKCGTNFLRLMASYLKSRTQVVSVKGTKSNVGEISSGFPQGSILGPLLFLSFILDLPLVSSKNGLAIDLYMQTTLLFMIFNQI